MSTSEERKKRVAIVGFAAHKDKAPFNDPEYEIWGLNELYNYIPRWDRWFELHDLDSPVAGQRNPQGHRDWLRNAKCPVYMQKKYDDIPNGLLYPKDKITARFGRYFTNSISWMIALAIDEGFTTIDLYGIDMAQDEEHKSQRPSVEYFMGLAKGMGIKMYCPPESDLLNTDKLYAFEKDGAMKLKIKARIEELKKRIVGYQQQKTQLQTAIDNLNGALQDCEYFLKVWS